VNALIPLPIIVPLLGAALCVIAAPVRWVQRIISLSAMTCNMVVAIILLVRVDDVDMVVMQAGGWPVPLGITLAVDRLSAVMLVVSSLMLLAVMVYAIGQKAEESRYAAFNPVYLVLAAGVSASFITGDLFNLFVAFEMMLVASYVLLTLGGRPDQVRAGMSYVVISLVASTFFVTALAVIYAATGTVNMAQLAERMPELPSGVATGFSLLLILVFGIKAGLFPLFFWLPDSYPTASGAITAVFAGLLTKVGVYAIIRTQTLMFPPDARQGTLLLVLAGLTMIVGVSLLVSLLTIYVMVRIWSNVFWGEAGDPAIVEWMATDQSRVPRLMTAAASAVVVLSVALMVFAGPLYDYAERTAADLLAPQQYIDAVVGGGGK
jgi:multicomponent Na+:H+ antiporter subunit D